MGQATPHIAETLNDLVANGPANTVELANRLSLGLMATTAAASDLIVRDYVERSMDGIYSATPAGREFHQAGGKLAYRAVKKGDKRKKKLCRETFRQRAWKGMRLHGRFTVPEILMLASRPSDRLPQNNLQRYLRELVKAEYIVRLPRNTEGSSLTSNGFPVYRLLKDVGEIAPVVSRDGSVIDHNQPMAARS